MSGSPTSLTLNVLLPIGLVLAFSCSSPAAGTRPGNSESSTVESKEQAPPQSDTTKIVNGHSVILRPGGQKLMEGDMRDGERHGQWTSYFENGQMQSRSDYEHGRLEGPTVVFRSDGALNYAGQYHDGKQVGTWKFHDETGALAKTVEYDSTGAVINDRP